MLEQVTVPILSTALVVGIIANALALVVIRRSYHTGGRSPKLSVPSLLIQSLVVVDLFSVVVLLLENAIFSAMFPGTVLKCNVDYITRLTVAYASGFINALMCLERCVAFRAPFYYHDHATVFRAKVLVVVAVCLSALLSCLPLVGVGNYAADSMMTSDNTTIAVCTPPGELGFRSDLGNRIFTGIYAVIGAVMLLTIYICNSLVVCTLRQLRRKTAGLENFTSSSYNISVVSGTSHNSQAVSETKTSVVNPRGDSNRRKSEGSIVDSTKGKDFKPKLNPERSKARIGREIRLAIMVCVISVVFTISWLPFYIQRLLKAFDINQPDWYLLVVIFLLVSNHVIDPFVFVFMKQQSRDALKDLCMKCVCCRKCRSPPATESQHSSSNGRHHRDASKQDSGVVVNVDPPYDLAHNRSQDSNHGHAPSSSFNIATSLALHPTQDSASYFVPSPDNTRNTEHDNSHNPGLNPAHNASTS